MSVSDDNSEGIGGPDRPDPDLPTEIDETQAQIERLTASLPADGGMLVWFGSPKVAGGVAIATVAAVVGIFVSGKLVDAKSDPDEDD